MGHIYFVQGSNTGFIKIGRTGTACSHRLKELQTGNPEKLILLHSVHDCYFTEGFLHHKFSRHRERGEWFRPDPEILDFIASLKEGRLISLPLPEGTAIKTPGFLGAIIHGQRVKLRWTQQELATRCKTSRKWIVDIEKGKPRAQIGLIFTAMSVLGLSFGLLRDCPSFIDEYLESF